MYCWKISVTKFGISAARCGCLYKCWLRERAKLSQNLIFSPDKGALLATTPIRFKKQGFQYVCAILVCSEIFIEVLKDHKKQALTLSEQKHHNTLKSLKCLAPNFLIAFISDLWLRRNSGKKLTNFCGYLNTLEEYSKSWLTNVSFYLRNKLQERFACIFPKVKEVNHKWTQLMY